MIIDENMYDITNINKLIELKELLILMVEPK